MPATVTIGTNEVTVRFHRRAHLPIVHLAVNIAAAAIAGVDLVADHELGRRRGC